MRKQILNTLLFLATGMMLVENTQAQQTPAANTQKAPATKAAPAPAPDAQKTPAAKTGQAAKPRTQPVLTLKTQKDKVSYALGANLGMNLHKESVEVDTAIVLRGLKDALAGGKLLLTDDEAKAALTQLQTDLRNKQMEKMKEAADLNKKAGTEFLEANKAKEGVVTLPSGLQYKILTEGTGPKPLATDTVSCNYRGTLLNGTEFDSSYKRGQPASFPVTGVIKGWTEALQLMPVGSKWQLFIASDLAYGDRGADPRSGIGPGATLIFEVELLSIQEKPKTAIAPKSPDK
ncbi:MAG TPA: FKBP-type peptidyl-prolyl cis-trans isomerase [Candidatus Elarobacter sp.]|nr:FKBP-type peptidyl-prolyl cis-trans isomerase [Candidatus Elarobacter sp.]